ncbi:hypothetical protein HYH03_006754 [Edaphochlamys debaryana]|uniref:Deleted in lung and esophageal cancer protein 1 Ig-like domain-containing protein n=1 Tax=Edaphochlamys debaryana TaxID=47281 RepID=A0A836BZU9_9CHLO|nr:hypothetical protein HYH03_006754 [Edaphochlamys debaryana]|eukprot:KAG2495146.1 hypothetical protein HYH03_006754 [Edaphochlamys debaryana]
MSSAHILDTFKSTFPGLYSARSEEKSDGGAEPAAAPAPEAPEPEPEPDPYNARIAGITSKFDKMRASADEMELYLRSKAEEAKEAEARSLAKADEEFTPAWRNVGLPLKPSHLQLDHGAMAGARLVNPKAIVQEYQAIKEREVLLPPRIAEYADTSAKPNYLKTTQAMEERKTRTMSPERTARIDAISQKQLTWHSLTADEVAAKMAEAEERRKQLRLKMPRAQFELEQKIIQSMHHKLTFLRNPRHPLPPAVKNLLDLRPDAKRWVGPRAELRTGAPPIKANMTSKPEAVFVVEPAEVTFTEYAVGRTYEQVVRVRNVTAVSRALRVFPPASQYFHASLPRFPGDEGVLAPGMAAEVTVRFCPDSLGDYEDAVSVDTQGSRLTVPLRARRPPPSLTLPEEIDMGQVVIGNVKTEQVSFKNLGGPGRFRIVPEAAWPDFAADAPTDRAVVGPFKVWPLYFEMGSNEELAINVSYEPKDWGNSDERLILVCDNCQVKTFTLLGNAVAVDVLLHSVDGRMLEPRELDLPLWFGEVAPRSGFSKLVSVRNTTKLPFAFEWSLTKFPQVQHKRRANEPLQTEAQYDEEQDDEGHVVLVDEHEGPRGAAAPSATGPSATGPLPAASSGGSVLLGGAQAPATTGPIRPVLLPGAENVGTPWGAITGGAHGPDPLALGAVMESVFRVVPQSGVLQPGEVMEFLFTFTPPACHRYERWAQLRVDRAPVVIPTGTAMLRGSGSGSGSSHAAIAAAATCDVLVAEVGLEGLGCRVELAAHPRMLQLPGCLMPMQRVVRTVQLSNPTRGTVDVRATVDNPALCVTPSYFTVPPLGSGAIEVAVTAPDAPPGPLTGRVVLDVENGVQVPIEVRACVGASSARLVTTRIDFGLLRLNGTGERPLVIRNSSATCATPWSVRELTPAVIAAEKSKLLRMQLMQSSRMLDPAAAAAAVAALDSDDGDTASGADPSSSPHLPAGPSGHSVAFRTQLGGADSPDTSASMPQHTARSMAAAAERRAMFASGRHGGVGGISSHIGGVPLGGGVGSASLLQHLPPPETTHVTFEPSSGVLAPGEELTITVTCHGLTDGRSRSVIQLRSGTDGAHMECLEAFVCVVTPTCVLDRPVVDLGVTFLGVQVRQTLLMTNQSLLPLEYRWGTESADDPETGALVDLKIKPEKGQLAPGEDVELQIRYTPRATGRSVMYGVCELDGAPQPLGFKVTSEVQGLDVTYDLLTPAELEDLQLLDAQLTAAGAPSNEEPKAGLLAQAAAAMAAGDPEVMAQAAQMVELLRPGRRGGVEVAVEALQGLSHLPPEILARVASGRTASTASGASRVNSAASVRMSARARSALAARRAQSAARRPMWPPTTTQRHFVADFGQDVPLGETRTLYLVITNRTAMHTSIRTWLERFGVEDASRFTKRPGQGGATAGAAPGGAGGGRASESGGAKVSNSGAGGHRQSHGGKGHSTSGGPPAGQRMDSVISLAETEGAGQSVVRIRASKYTPIRLSDAAEKHAPFRSGKGNEMMATRRLQEEADQALGSKGLAVSVAPPESTLEPWSRLVLVVSCFNDMCGAYMDTLHVKVGDLPARQVPVLVGVSGTPLVVQRERVLTRGLRDRSWRTSLEWGQVPLGVEQQRTFYVFNTGSLDMHLSWQFHRFKDYIDLDPLPPTTDCAAGGFAARDSLWGGAPGVLRDTRKEHQVLDVKLQADERAGAVKLVATRHGDPDVEPYEVTPKDLVIKGGTSAKFTVTFSAPTPRDHYGFLQGTQRVFSPENPAVQLRLWPKGDAGDKVGALMSGTFHPYAGAPPTPLQTLRVDLSGSSLPSRLEPDGHSDLSWTVTSIHQPASHPSFVHSVTLSNIQECPQVFSLGVEGPWDLLAATPSVPQDPVAYRGTSTLLGKATATGRLGQNGADGGLLFLPPRECVDVTLRFVPGKGDMEALPVRFAAMQAKQRVVETTTDYKNSGALNISFANGDAQKLPLIAEMLHPRLEVKPRKLDFGPVHLQSPKELTVTLSNPTTVDAAWAVTVDGVKPRFPTLPGAGAAASAQAEAAAKEAAAAKDAAAAAAAAAATPRSAAESTNPSRGGSAGSSRTASAMPSRLGTADAAAAPPAVGGGVPPPPKIPAAPAAMAGVTGIIAEARIGPYIVRPASGVLPGRGLGLPRSQTIRITFAPTEEGCYEGELIFAVLRGKDCSVDVDGEGSIEETDEHKGKLFVI